MIDAIGNEVTILEEENLELAQFLMDISQDKKPYNITKIHSHEKGIIIKECDDYILIQNPISAPVVVGRNEPCSCGSGKKYKKCCGGN